jgi:hypothetical protein
MEDQWQFQLRLVVSNERAAVLRTDPLSHAYAPLHDVLRRHDAALRCQLDAFADYVKAAETAGPAHYPLYEWTRQTIENPEKQAKYLRTFTVYVDGAEVYDKDVADSLESALSALAGDAGIERVSKFDTNPANNPQPPGSGR